MTTEKPEAFEEAWRLVVSMFDEQGSRRADRMLAEGVSVLMWNYALLAAGKVVSKESRHELNALAVDPDRLNVTIAAAEKLLREQ